MDNLQLAQVFENIANLLSIKGEATYRVAAYRRVSENLRSLATEAEVLQQEGRLREIPGVGEAISKKIEELLQTGKLAFFEKLAAEVPSSLLQILQVSDVGPKRAALFWKELGITALEDLEEAAREGKLSQLPGMGKRSEARILESIEALKHRETGRLSISQALHAAAVLLERLRAVSGVKKAEAAGSLRRWRETIGDIDLLVAANKSEPVMDALLGFPEVKRVRGRGETKASVELKGGLEVQVWVHPPERFGSALQYATGSQAHNVRLRELARTKGLSLSEHGFRAEDGLEILCAEEAQVYKTLGLPWIPPELREDRGELEAATDGRLPDLITLEQMKGDLQVHTEWSDGTSTILEMAQAARDSGLEYLAITDHSKGLGVARGLSIERLREQKKAIAEAQRALGNTIHLLHGTEVEILADGSLDYPDEVLAELDLVLASLHSSLRQPRERVTARVVSALRNPHVDLLGHPSGRLIGSRDPADLNMEKVLEAAAEAGVALEINASPDRLDLTDVYARRAAEMGCLLTINTDAHQPGQLGFLKYGVAVARRGWVHADAVINTWPFDKLQAWLEARD